MRSRFATALGLAGAVLALDQATKVWVQSSIDLWKGVPVVPGFFNLVHVLNKGAAFGLLNDDDLDWQRWFFIAVSVAAVAVVLHLLRTERTRAPFLRVGLGLVLGGALGNLVDRVRTGLVVDFLDFHVGTYHWPAFNVADSAITVGVFALFVSLYRSRRAPRDNGRDG